MSHMKLKKIKPQTKFKTIIIFISFYIIFSYTFYNSFKTNNIISNKSFITFLLNNGNANFINEYKLPSFINSNVAVEPEM